MSFTFRFPEQLQAPALGLLLGVYMWCHLPPPGAGSLLHWCDPRLLCDHAYLVDLPHPGQQLHPPHIRGPQPSGQRVLVACVQVWSNIKIETELLSWQWSLFQMVWGKDKRAVTKKIQLTAAQNHQAILCAEVQRNEARQFSVRGRALTDIKQPWAKKSAVQLNLNVKFRLWLKPFNADSRYIDQLPLYTFTKLDKA